MAKTIKNISADIEKVYTRTLNNCMFYMRENDRVKLFGEMEALRGIAYCIQEALGDESVWERPEWDFLPNIKLGIKKEVQ